MERVHKERIQVNFLLLAEAIRHQILELVKYVSQEQLISHTMEEDILYRRTPSEKAYAFLDIIQTRGPRAFGVFYKATCDLNIWDAANILEPSRGQHAPTVGPSSAASVTSSGPVEEDEPLPDDWLSQSHLSKVELSRLKVKKVEERQTEMISYFQNPNENKVYELNQRRKGWVLIIDNKKFTNGLKERRGSEKDTRGLKSILEDMNFDVWPESNKTKQQMDDIVEEQRTQNFEDYSSFILIMLSHGVRGKVFGTDGKMPKDRTQGDRVENYIEIEDVKKRIAQNDTLKGKPKMFIIQACQTDEASTSDHEPMVHESSAANNGNATSSENPGALGASQAMDQRWVQEVGKDGPDGDQTLVKKSYEDSDRSDGPNAGSLDADGNPSSDLPEGLDVFTALATIEGYPSYRNTVFGSWFIQAFIYVLANYAHKLELTHLMYKVTDRVAKARGGQDENQVCEMRSTLHKRFYFFPGLPRDSA